MSLHELYSRFPSLNCSSCFIPTCRSLARRSAMGLSNPSDCPIIEWVEGGHRKALAQEAATRFRNHQTETRASILGTDHVVVHPAVQSGMKPIEFLDTDLGAKLFGLSGIFDRVESLSQIGAFKASRGKVSCLFVSDGRMLLSGPGPPTEALSPLANLTWGAANP